MLPLVALSVLQLGIPVLAPAFVSEAGLAPEAVGIIGGCIGFGSVWMFAANSRITPVLGPLRALAWACVLGIFGMALVLTGWSAAIFPGAVLVGFAYAVTAPAGSQILSAHAPRRLWGTLFSIRQAGVPLGGAIAGVVGTGLAVAYGWQAGLACLALLPAACVILLLSAPESYRGGSDGSAFRLRDLVRPALIATPFRTLRELPQLRSLTLSSLGFAAVQGSMFSFLTTYLTDGLGLGLPFAGALFATMQVAAFLGRLGAGVVADRIGAFRPVLMAMSLAGAVSCVVMGILDPEWPRLVLFVIAALTGLGAATWNGLFLAEIARVVPAEMVSQATAGTTFFTFVAYMVTPPAFAGLVLTAGYQAAFGAAAVAALFALACLLISRPGHEGMRSSG
jgi:MFS family permease